jgi:hypothetical protein
MCWRNTQTNECLKRPEWSHSGRNDYSISANNYSWDKLADYVWIDQPVYVLTSIWINFIESYFSGTGWATADSTGYGELLGLSSLLSL